MTSVILLRTHRFRPQESAFAHRLQSETGRRVYILADETHGVLDTHPFPKVPITPSIVKSLQLPCPRDFAWRCGDYGFYAARLSLPAATGFWLIEPDVWFSTQDVGAVFARVEAMGADFVAPHVQPAGRAHFWFPTMGWAGTEVYRCSFAFCRISAAAADFCLRERMRLARCLPARIMWANDETFVATILRRGGLALSDLNAGGPPICTAESFGFARPHRGETVVTSHYDGLIYHPVLWGTDYERKVHRIARGLSLEEMARLKIQRGLNRLLAQMKPHRELAQ